MNASHSTSAHTAPEATAFVLAGGGNLGAVQAGMLAELIVGVSAGALNGAFLAVDTSLAMVERINELWRRVTTREALGLSWRSLRGSAPHGSSSYPAASPASTTPYRAMRWDAPCTPLRCWARGSCGKTMSTTPSA